MINFNSDRIVLFYYPQGSGGKFLINSLGLSDYAVFQHRHYAEEQLKGRFTKKDKIDYLITEINKVKNTWNDLNLGSSALFGEANVVILRTLRFPLANEIKSYLDFNQIIDTLSESELYFFNICHTTQELEKSMQFWPQAKVVEFINYNYFLKKYRTLDNKHYELLKGTSWPENYPSINEYLKLDKDIQNEINEFYPSFKFFQDNPEQAKRIIYSWNTENYESYEQTLKHFKKLCNVLELNDIDFDDFELYYKAWINKLNELSLNYKQE